MKSFIKQRLRETINASDAHTDVGSIQTIIDGRRNIAFISLPNSELMDIIKKNDLGVIKVEQNDYETYIIYRKGAENEAKELLNIANKYGGYLSYEAEDDEIRRIGQLLNYKSSDVEEYIIMNNRNKNNDK